MELRTGVVGLINFLIPDEKRKKKQQQHKIIQVNLLRYNEF